MPFPIDAVVIGQYALFAIGLFMPDGREYPATVLVVPFPAFHRLAIVFMNENPCAIDFGFPIGELFVELHGFTVLDGINGLGTVGLFLAFGRGRFSTVQFV
ncbi:MAG: hypothetical protein ABSG38_16385 [Spirochaetia bacterium]